MTSSIPIRRALVSVSDKTGIVDFTRELTNMGVEILSTGGTYRLLKENDIPVTEVSDYTGFPEMMDGRVKTLHPKVHGGILARRGTDDTVMAEHGINAIDLVVVNLYPFEQTVANPDCTLADAIENIDIGGPTMVRAAAKNHAWVSIVVNASDYNTVLADMKANDGATTQETRFDLAIKAYEHTAAYDGAIANYFGRLVPGGSENFPRTFNSQFSKVAQLRPADLFAGDFPEELRDAGEIEARVAGKTTIDRREVLLLTMSDVVNEASAYEMDAFGYALIDLASGLPLESEVHITVTEPETTRVASLEATLTTTTELRSVTSEAEASAALVR